ncbi:MAG: helix-turn-helix transcriptional regulator [Oxalobacter formigenes]|nr:helix-turn-helix transcriptional regulator [Oxalobacter formigenes]
MPPLWHNQSGSSTWQCHAVNKNMTNAELMEQAGISANIITKLKRNNYLSLDTIEKICSTLHCGVDDVLEFEDVSKEGNQ